MFLPHAICGDCWTGLGGQRHRRDTRKRDRSPVRKLSDKGQASAHGFDGTASGLQMCISVRFSIVWYLLLRDAETFGHAHLRQLARLAQLLQRHFLCNQNSGARLDLLAASRADFLMTSSTFLAMATSSPSSSLDPDERRIEYRPFGSVLCRTAFRRHRIYRQQPTESLCASDRRRKPRARHRRPHRSVAPSYSGVWSRSACPRGDAPVAARTVGAVLANARISVCTSSGSAKNSGSNSSPIRTCHFMYDYTSKGIYYQEYYTPMGASWASVLAASPAACGM